MQKELLLKMILMGIDPSFKHLAFSIYTPNKKIYMDMASVDLGNKIGFEKVYHACHELWKQFDDKLTELNLPIDKVISEIPPPIGNFAPGLYALDTFILSNLFNKYKSINEIWVVPPSYLSVVHGTRKYKKSESTTLAKYYLEEVFNNEYEVIIPNNITATGRKTKGKINNDKAESFLFLLRLMCKLNVENKGNLISTQMSGLGYEAEKLLVSRGD